MKKDKRLVALIDGEMQERINKLALEDGVSVGEWVRRVIQQKFNYIDRRS